MWGMTWRDIWQALPSAEAVTDRPRPEDGGEGGGRHPVMRSPED